MAEEADIIDLGIADDGAPVVLIGEDGEAGDMAGLLRLAPALASASRATELARAVNHFAHRGDYDVIVDPQEFADAYRARLATEDPALPWREGVIRLCDHGVPDFEQIQPPSFAGGRLVFHAVDVVLGLPYRVEAAGPSFSPVYQPLGLTPVAGPSHIDGDQDRTPTTGKPPGVVGKRRQI